jgi:hypothetical protein
VPQIAGERLTSNESDTRLKFNQLGGVLVFETAQNDWKSFAIGINSQNIGAINQTISVGRDTGARLYQDPNNPPAPADLRIFDGYLSEIQASNFRTNLTFAGNYQDNLYIGGSFDLYNNSKNISNTLYTEENGVNYSYVKENSPISETGNGFGLSVGLIYKPIQEVRLGLSYKSPVWYTIDRQIPFYEEVTETNGDFRRRLSNYDVFTYDVTTPATVNMGMAYVFGRKGLLSIDYSLKNYNGVSIRPNANYQEENQLLDNVFQSTSTVRVGAEYRVNNIFTFRGGFRFDESPINFDKLVYYNNTTGSGMNFYGDTKAISLGIGFKLGQNSYLDATYNYQSRDRELFIYGEHFDVFKPGPDSNSLVVDFTQNELGSLIIQNMKEINHNISFTLGFRF